MDPIRVAVSLTTIDRSSGLTPTLLLEATEDVDWKKKGRKWVVDITSADGERLYVTHSTKSPRRIEFYFQVRERVFARLTPPGKLVGSLDLVASGKRGEVVKRPDGGFVIEPRKSKILSLHRLLGVKEEVPVVEIVPEKSTDLQVFHDFHSDGRGRRGSDFFRLVLRSKEVIDWRTVEIVLLDRRGQEIDILREQDLGEARMRSVRFEPTLEQQPMTLVLDSDYNFCIRCKGGHEKSVVVREDDVLIDLTQARKPDRLLPYLRNRGILPGTKRSQPESVDPPPKRRRLEESGDAWTAPSHDDYLEFAEASVTAACRSVDEHIQETIAEHGCLVPVTVDFLHTSRMAEVVAERFRKSNHEVSVEGRILHFRF